MGLTAQVVRGVTRDQETGDPLAFTTVELLDRGVGEEVRARIISDSTGHFLVRAPGAGRYRLRAQRIGYMPVTSPPFDLVAPDTLEVELNASVDAVPLAPLVILSDRMPLVGTSGLELGGFFERNRMYGDLGTGAGHFIQQEEWRNRAPNRVSDLLRDMPGVYVVGGYRPQIYFKRITDFNPLGCRPTVYLNGQLIRFGEGDSVDDLISASSIKAVEIYPGVSRPAQFMDMGAVPCGAIVIWTG